MCGNADQSTLDLSGMFLCTLSVLDCISKRHYRFYMIHILYRTIEICRSIDAQEICKMKDVEHFIMNVTTNVISSVKYDKQICHSGRIKSRLLT